ncbi:MAG: helix-turn-helix domain-containing protein [Cyanobacteria bacterium REEB65]|nr:helix-turn-helix domain-containing protein [Cyanobacteria bacterium REEB65]
MSSPKTQADRHTSGVQGTMPGDLLTPDQAAEILNLDVTTIYAKLRAGEIPYLDLAKRARRIRRSDLEAFIQSKVRGGEAAASTGSLLPGAPNLADYWASPKPCTARQARKGAAQ